MGFNSSMIVLNDALHSIKEDKDFGKKVSDAILSLSIRSEPIDISSGCNCNAATVIETHHADSTSVIAFGGNCGFEIGSVCGWQNDEIDILKALAKELGYRLVKVK